jgi:(1->4)-alpha-D-glucan 1-alpha-D-glucosylmutase
MSLSTTPRATYRLQFFAGFTFDDAIPWVPYLAGLGISHLYASPILKARPGSTHCYDIVDHGQINPELGGEPALRRLVRALRAHKMGLLVDIVPNHMGVGGADNAWWLDLLEFGRSSHYAEFFDIDWDPPDASLHGKILAPFLGSAYGETLANGELILECDADTGALHIQYHEHRFPISPRGAAIVLHNEIALKPIAAAFAQSARAGSRNLALAEAARAKAMLAEAIKTADGQAAVTAALARFSADTAEGQRRLHELLERQHYRLAWWRAAADEINWRRFFDINTLAGLRVELPRVFDATHKLILQLYAEGLIDGVRIDHVDGLADPRLYCRKLRRAMEVAGESRPASAPEGAPSNMPEGAPSNMPEGAPSNMPEGVPDNMPQGAPYIVIEKILAPRERLAADWLTNGTTGYDFMDQVAGVLHNPEGEAPLTHVWISLTGRPGLFEEEEEAARRQILRDNLASELNANAAALHRIARRDLFTRDFTLTALRRGLTEILVHFPVYRIYAGKAGRSEVDAQVMDRALAGAHRSFRTADRGVLDVVRSWLSEEPPRSLPAGPRRTERLRAMVRFQQLSAPTAAKSVEDTAFYRYGRLLSRNEVGSNPSQFAISPAAFHAAAQERFKRLPTAMLATATHDHKRGEDTRARLASLSEIPAEWEAALIRWTRLNAIIRRDFSSGPVPSPADEIMLYQTLVAAWPIGLGIDDIAGIKTFAERIAGWQMKSIREAKLLSEWAAPNAEYEGACEAFLHDTLDPSRPVLADIIQFASRLDLPGAINGLAQTLLRLTAPGVPDFYQGAEFWDQSLVDPDNRRPVDYAARAGTLGASTPAQALAHWQDGAVKQSVIARALRLRAENPTLFIKGNYTKLEAEGPAAAHVLAFARRHEGKTIVAAVTRLSVPLLGDAELPLVPASAWADTTLALPRADATDALTGQRFTTQRLPIAELFATLPIALLRL